MSHSPGGTPGRNKSPDEMVDLVDAENRVLGQTTRQRVRSENLLHRGVAILVTNARQEVYVHQRTATKDLFPSYYDMFVGGVVAAGENYDMAARRELGEELGISGIPLEGDGRGCPGIPLEGDGRGCSGIPLEGGSPVEPQLMFEHLYEGPENRSWIFAFQVEWNGSVRHQPEEVAWGEWIPKSSLQAWVAAHSIVPDGLEVFMHYLRWKDANP